jgi:hypothetical protein
MKRIAAVALGVLLAALPAVAATADQAKPADPAKPPASAPKSGNVSGTVAAVSNTSLTVKASTGEQVFTIDDKTKVVGAKMGRKADAMKKAGEKTVITEFVETGDMVRVNYKDDAGTKKASEVHVTKKAKVQQ